MRENMNDGMVYIIRSGGLIKIGSARDPKTRLAQLRTGSALPMFLINTFKIEFCQDAERKLHAKYRKFRCHGEWFILPDDEIEFLHRISDLSHYLDQMIDPWQFPAKTRDDDLERKYKSAKCSCVSMKRTPYSSIINGMSLASA